MNIDQKVIERIKSLQKPSITGVSGFGGSGKSTFAKELGERINAPVVGVDSFQKNRSDVSYELWSIMDFARLEQEVLIPFQNGSNPIRYGHFDWVTNGIGSTREFANTGTIFVEGVGLFRPELMKYFALTIWIDCDLEKAIARGKKRDGEVNQNPQDELWDGLWKQNDIQYRDTFKPEDIADTVIYNRL